MDLKIIKVGYLETNCYILSIKNKALIIDPGDEKDKIINYLDKNNLDLIAILITHSHFDHIGALNNILKYKKVDVYDNSNLKEQNYNIGPFTFDVIKAYGHTNDSVIYYFKKDNIMFVGDFIFKNSIGRTDMPTGNDIDMKSSIKMIKQYPDNTIIYPGHGDSTTLKEEKINNPFFTYFS